MNLKCDEVPGFDFQIRTYCGHYTEAAELAAEALELLKGVPDAEEDTGGGFFSGFFSGKMSSKKRMAAEEYVGIKGGPLLNLTGISFAEHSVNQKARMRSARVLAMEVLHALKGSGMAA